MHYENSFYKDEILTVYVNGFVNSDFSEYTDYYWMPSYTESMTDTYYFPDNWNMNNKHNTGQQKSGYCEDIGKYDPIYSFADNVRDGIDPPIGQDAANGFMGKISINNDILDCQDFSETMDYLRLYQTINHISNKYLFKFDNIKFTDVSNQLYSNGHIYLSDGRLVESGIGNLIDINFINNSNIEYIVQHVGGASINQQIDIGMLFYLGEDNIQGHVYIQHPQIYALE